MKVTVIPIDLGYNVDDIIQEGVQEVTGEAKKELNMAISLAKQRDALLTKQKMDKQNSTNATSAALEKAYLQIQQAGETGVECDVILESLKNYVPNTSGFTLRMKKLLRDKGNPYTINRVKIQGKFYYIFKNFNLKD